MEKKYQIFISSTYEDLKEERRKVQDTILSMYQFPIGMEMFSAADEEQWEIIQETIDSSDYYVLIIGHRYGSIIENGECAGISYTQKEYRYAAKKQIPILAFLIDSSVAIIPEKMEQNTNKRKKLDAFIEEVKKGRTVQWWTSKEDLANKVMNSLNKQFARGKRPGWVRANGLKLEETQAELVEISKENRRLREENEKLKRSVQQRKPIFELKFNNNDFISCKCKNVSINDIEAEFMPITSEYLKDAGLEGKIPQKDIDDYNSSLPSEAEIREYLDKYKIFRGIKYNKIPFVVKIKNVGNCKANDINIQIHMPTGVRIFSKVMLEELKEPKAPETLENPINSFYSKSYLGAATSSLENIFNVGRGVGAYNISSLTNSFSINNDEEIKDNCLNIWNRSMIHTGEYESEEYYLIPLKNGKYEMEIRIVCEEFAEENIQKYEIIVE